MDLKLAYCLLWTIICKLNLFIQRCKTSNLYGWHDVLKREQQKSCESTFLALFIFENWHHDFWLLLFHILAIFIKVFKYGITKLPLIHTRLSDLHILRWLKITTFLLSKALSSWCSCLLAGVVSYWHVIRVLPFPVELRVFIWNNILVLFHFHIHLCFDPFLWIPILSWIIKWNCPIYIFVIP